MKIFIYILIGVILGVAFTVITVIKIFPSQMIISQESLFGYKETVKMIEEKTEESGWAIMKEWDLTKRMINAGYDDAPTVKVLELCQVRYTYDILCNKDDRFISAIMPYRIAVYELENGKVMISRMNIDLMSRLFSRNIRNVMSKAVEDDHNILKDIITKSK
ncbi:MAG: DUF302 domain-containing protein [Candidatus Delongbacteria bacterium]|nr:DUF302 domain-containing protein [Candidatus Delongbacteria bacterium]